MKSPTSMSVPKELPQQGSKGLCETRSVGLAEVSDYSDDALNVEWRGRFAARFGICFRDVSSFRLIFNFSSSGI